MRVTLKKELGRYEPGDRFDHTDCLIERVKVCILTLESPERSLGAVHNSGRVRSGQIRREAGWS